MHDNLTQSCAENFGPHVKELFAEAERLAKGDLARGRTKVRAPITGLLYDSWFDEEAERAQRMACAALVACAQFKKDFPTWPDLPVSCAALDQLSYDLQQRDAGDMQMLLMFGLSQRYHCWDHRHPGFRDFGRSVLASADASDTIRKNEELKKQFPPAPVVELFRRTEGTFPGLRYFLHWLNPEKAAHNKAWEAFHEVRAAGGSVEKCREAWRRAFRGRASRIFNS